MESRRSFIRKTSLAGIGGIITSGKAPAYAQDLNMIKVGQIGLGSHSFLLRFLNPPKSFKEPVRCKPNGVWDDEPGVAEAMSKRGYGKVYKDYATLTKESDAVHIEHADYRRVFEFAQPALEA